jgi:hypothetical protein
MKFALSDLMNTDPTVIKKDKDIKIALGIFAVATAWPVGVEHTPENLITAMPLDENGNPKAVVAVGTLKWEEGKPVVVVSPPQTPTVTGSQQPTFVEPTGRNQCPAGYTYDSLAYKCVLLTTSQKLAYQTAQKVVSEYGGHFGEAAPATHERSLAGSLGGRGPGGWGSRYGTHYELFGLAPLIEVYGAEVSLNNNYLLFFGAIGLLVVGVILYRKREELEG